MKEKTSISCPHLPFIIIMILVSGGMFSGCASSPQTNVHKGFPSGLSRSQEQGTSPRRTPAAGYTQTGKASWYGKKFHGRKTASGEAFNMYRLTAAHRTLPFNTMVEVTHQKTGAAVHVRINDRGPFTKNRIIDLSYAAAKKLGIIQTGTAPVRIRIIPAGRS